MSEPLEISGTQTIPIVEDALRHVERSDEPCDIKLATHLKAWRIGGKAALLQCLITWGRRHPHSRLITYWTPESENRERYLERLIARDVGLVATMMAGDIVSSSGESLKEQSYALAHDRVKSMWHGARGAGRGSGVLLACFDRTSLANLPAFYFRSGQLKGNREYQSLVNELIERTAPDPAITHVDASTQQGLEAILCELIRNTHQWARDDERGARITRSVRGLLFEAHNAPTEEFLAAVDGCPPLQVYVNHTRFAHEGGRQRFLEMSVFDSGPGLASRWLSRGTESMSLDEEYDACLKCLLKHGSSSNDRGRGLGLHHVMRTLTALGGFLRVRTGRLSLYRDFEEAPYLERQSRPDREEVELHDWQSQTTSQRTMGSAVAGTLYTMLFPLQRRRS
jgi:hypothetical protein